MPSLDLTPQQRRWFSAVLGQAFPLQRLRELLDYRLDRSLEDITLGDDYQQIRFVLIQTAQAQGWAAELLAAAREENPGNTELLAFAQEVGLSPATLAQERALREQSPFFDIARFRSSIGEIEGRVCRIEIRVPGGTAYGTGFLVGPSVVMTNHHVMAPVLDGTAHVSQAIFRFDYKALDMRVVNQGTPFGLEAEDWLVDDSPLSPIDLEPEPKSTEPSASELDYTLVRLEGEPGAGPIGDGDENSPSRGWIEVTTPRAAVGAGSPLFIVQHPDSTPLKLALEMDGVVGLFAGDSRLRHRVNTEKGSSGSPCFNSDWELVGLHHVGDPNFDRAHKPEYNEAISLAAIIALVEQRGKLQALGDHEH